MLQNVTVKFIRDNASTVKVEFRDQKGKSPEQFNKLLGQNLRWDTWKEELAEKTGISLSEIDSLVKEVLTKSKSPDGTKPSLSRVFEFDVGEAPSPKSFRIDVGTRTLTGRTAKEALDKAVSTKPTFVSAEDQEQFCFVVASTKVACRLSKIVPSPLYYTVCGEVVNLLFCEWEGFAARELASAFSLVASVEVEGANCSLTQTLTLPDETEFHSVTSRSSRGVVRQYFGFGSDETADIECPSLTLARMVKGKTHWLNQGESMLRAEAPGLSEETRRVGYHCLIGLAYGKDSHIYKHILTVGKYVVRTTGGYVGSKDLYPLTHCREQAKKLTAVIDEKGAVDRELLEIHTQAGDLTHLGYPALTPIFGLSPYFVHQRSASGQIPYNVSPPHYSQGNNERCRPRYLKASDRIPIDDAYGELERYLPGLPRSVLELLLVQKGYADGDLEDCLYILLIGTTGAGKSVLPKLAAALYGDLYTEFGYDKNHERLYQKVVDALKNGSYVQLAEYFKSARRERTKPRDATDLLLNLTPNTSVWKLYKGGEAMKRLPALSISDTDLPTEVREEPQFGRRTAVAKLDVSMEVWRANCVAAGFNTVSNYRTHSLHNAKVSDSIISYVADTYFKERRVWKEVVNSLGFSLLGDVVSDNLLQFFRYCCERPDASDEELYAVGAVTLKGERGWKMIVRGENSELASVWHKLSDIQTGGKWSTSRNVQALNWNLCLTQHRERWGIPDGKVVVDLRDFGEVVLVRFDILNGGVRVPVPQLEVTT